MILRAFLFGVLFLSLVSCSTSSKKTDDARDEAAAEEGEGGEEEGGLSDEPMDDDEGGGGNAAEKSLFDRLGGKAALESFSSKFVDNLAANAEMTKNPAIAQALSGDQARHKQMLAEYFCANTVGSCQYSGRGIKETHAPLKVSTTEWNVLRKVFIKTLKQMKVPKKERMDLALIAARQKKQIVAQ